MFFGRVIIFFKFYLLKSKKNSRIILIKMFKIYCCFIVNWNDKILFFIFSLVKIFLKCLLVLLGFC